MPTPLPQFGNPQPERAGGGSSTATRLVVASLLTAFVIGYLLAAFLTRDIWHSAREGTSLTFTAQTRDGSAPPSSETMAKAGEIAGERLKSRGAAVAVNGLDVIVTVPGRNVKPDALRDVLRMGRLNIRPVVQTIPAQPQTSPAKPADPTLVGLERQIRQSDNPQMQALALQLQASRCHDGDSLAGQDDPALPLVTCSEDGSVAYLLDKSLLDSTDIAKASSGFDDAHGIYVVSVEFAPRAAKIWADFTSKNWQSGTQTAFTVDTRVISAPMLREPIPGGRVEVTGGFTHDSARALAGVLTSGSMPVSLSFISSADQSLGPTTFSMVLRVVVIGMGVGLAAIVIVTVVYLARRRPTQTGP